MRARGPNVIGYVDHAGGGLVRGWAADLAAPDRRLMVDVVRHGILLGCARTGAARDDLRAQGIGDGAYGFVFHSPALNGDDLDGLDLVAGDAARTRLALPGAHPAPAAAGTANFDNEIRDVLAPLVEALATASEPGGDLVTPPSTRRCDILLGEDRRDGASAFAAHIAAKYERPAPAKDQAAFWRWYLGVYGVEQPHRVPLSARDLGRLEALGLAGAGRRRRLVRRHSSDFDWGVHESRRLKVEDCLVDEATATALRRVPWFDRRAFPLSRFMHMMRGRHGLLQHLPIASAVDRVAFYTVLMLLALRDAHYIAYMPAAWVDRMLETTRGDSPFEAVQRRLLGRAMPLLTPERYRDCLHSHEFDPAVRRFRTMSAAGRPATPSAVVANESVDVQMIGPFHQSLGLAESARRIARALQASGLGVNLVDYPVGMSRGAAASGIATGQARAASINILHLNAEEVPEAIAYRPVLGAAARTILIPYWELDRPAAAHRLGLALVDEVWCASRFLADVFAGPKPVVPIGMSYDDHVSTNHREKADATTFDILVVADASSGLCRKNVLGAVEAFRAAFPRDRTVRLTVKARNLGAALAGPRASVWQAVLASRDADPRITLLDAELPPDEQKALLARSDCLLSLHRAEGLGLDILDALALGVPVVATAYSGNTDVCTAETAWLVDYDLVPVASGDYPFVEPGHVWAEPRLASAVAALRAVRHDPAARTRKVATAQAQVRGSCAPDVLAARLGRLLRARLAPRPVDQLVSGSILPR